MDKDIAYDTQASDEISDELLESIVGGAGTSGRGRCPRCGSTVYTVVGGKGSIEVRRCSKCGNRYSS